LAPVSISFYASQRGQTQLQSKFSVVSASTATNRAQAKVQDHSIPRFSRIFALFEQVLPTDTGELAFSLNALFNTGFFGLERFALQVLEQQGSK